MSKETVESGKTIIPSREGSAFWVDQDGKLWLPADQHMDWRQRWGARQYNFGVKAARQENERAQELARWRQCVIEGEGSQAQLLKMAMRIEAQRREIASLHEQLAEVRQRAEQYARNFCFVPREIAQEAMRKRIEKDAELKEMLARSPNA